MENEIKAEDFNYTFEKWISGIAEPEFDLWYAFFSGKGNNPEYNKIIEAKENTFKWSFDVAFKSMKDFFIKQIDGLTESKKKSYTDKLIQDSEKHFNDFDIIQLISQRHPQKFDGIDGIIYSQVNQSYAKFKTGESIVFAHFRNEFFDAVLYYELTEFYKEYLILQPIEVEKLENLPHKLCILYDLGILDLIEDRFKDKNYKGKARETDTARLIASLLEIHDPEKVRTSLRKKDFLNPKQEKNTIQTLKNHGLEPLKLTD